MHWVACLYYTISEYEGLGTNDWVYTETEQEGDPFTRFGEKNCFSLINPLSPNSDKHLISPYSVIT